MESSSKCTSGMALEIPPYIRIYKDGRVERLLGTHTIPPSLDAKTGVDSKDVVISLVNNFSARLYIPAKLPTNNDNQSQKIPLLVYFHGGGFCIETAFSPTYHNYLNNLVSQANVVVVSVDYRKAPEHPLPIAYEDSWLSLKWVASHSNCDGPEAWLNDHADFQRVWMAGDSAGANIAHHMAMRAGSEELAGIKLAGIILVHPLFWGKEAIGDEVKKMEKKSRLDKLWFLVCPGTSGCDDPLINPVTDLKKMSGLGCTKVLVCAAGKDVLKDRSWSYYEGLRKSGWRGEVEMMEVEGEDHAFHLFKPSCVNAAIMMKKIVSFIIEDHNKALFNIKGMSCL